MTAKELHKEIRHILGYCRYHSGRECPHTPVDGAEEELDAIMALVAEHDKFVIGEDIQPHLEPKLGVKDSIYLSGEDMNDNELRAEQRKRAGI